MKLYAYFGIVGIASIMAWAVALGILIFCARSRWRHQLYIAAMGLAVAAYVLARINSSNVSAIQLDQREEMAEARDAQQRLREQVSEDGRIVGKRFAEDAPGEEKDAAGKRQEAGTNSAAAAAATNAPVPAPAAEPSYRVAGKQSRESGKKQPVVKASETAAPEEKVVARMMKGPDLALANRLDRYNLLVVRLLLFVALVSLGWDYLKRFNTTFECHYPLPIAGVWLDVHFPKSHTVLLPNPAHHPVQTYMEKAVQKGETFIYFGRQDPWPETALPRLGIGRRGIWPLPKLVFGSPGTPSGSNFILDAAWFGRYCVVIRETDIVPAFMDDLIEYLDARHRTGAAARRAVNLVWELPALPAQPVFERLARLCREANFKIVVASPSPLDPEVASLFEEVYP